MKVKRNHILILLLLLLLWLFFRKNRTSGQAKGNDVDDNKGSTDWQKFPDSPPEQPNDPIADPQPDPVPVPEPDPEPLVKYKCLLGGFEQPDQQGRVAVSVLPGLNVFRYSLLVLDNKGREVYSDIWAARQSKAVHRFIVASDVSYIDVKVISYFSDDQYTQNDLKRWSIVFPAKPVTETPRTGQEYEYEYSSPVVSPEPVVEPPVTVPEPPDVEVPRREYDYNYSQPVVSQPETEPSRRGSTPNTGAVSPTTPSVPVTTPTGTVSERQPSDIEDRRTVVDPVPEVPDVPVSNNTETVSRNEYGYGVRLPEPDPVPVVQPEPSAPVVRTQYDYQQSVPVQEPIVQPTTGTQTVANPRNNRNYAYSAGSNTEAGTTSNNVTRTVAGAAGGGGGRGDLTDEERKFDRSEGHDTHFKATN